MARIGLICPYTRRPDTRHTAHRVLCMQSTGHAALAQLERQLDAHKHCLTQMIPQVPSTHSSVGPLSYDRRPAGTAPVASSPNTPKPRGTQIDTTNLSPPPKEMSDVVVVQSIASNNVASSNGSNINVSGDNENAGNSIVGQGASSRGTWTLSMGNALGTKQYVRMEIEGWALPQTTWTVEPGETNIPLAYGTRLFTNEEDRTCVLETLQTLEEGDLSEIVTVTVVLPPNVIEIDKIERIDDQTMRFTARQTICSRFYDTLVAYEEQGLVTVLQGVRGWFNGAFPLITDQFTDTSTSSSSSDQAILPNIFEEGNNDDLTNSFLVTSRQWVTFLDEFDPGWEQNVLKPRRFGDSEYPQCFLTFSAFNTPVQFASVLTSAFTPLLPVGITCGFSYIETEDRFAFRISPNDSFNSLQGGLLRQLGYATSIDATSFQIAVAQSGQIAALQQRPQSRLSYAYVQPGVYKGGDVLSGAINKAFDSIWFGPVDDSPSNGNARKFTLAFRLANGAVLYPEVTSGRYTPDGLAREIAIATNIAFMNTVRTFEEINLFQVKVIPLVERRSPQDSEPNVFYGLIFENTRLTPFELLFDHACTTIDPVKLGYKGMTYVGRVLYTPDAAGSLANANGRDVFDIVTRVDGFTGTRIPNEFIRPIHIPYTASPFTQQQVLPQLRLESIFTTEQNHLRVGSLSLPVMQNCRILARSDPPVPLVPETQLPRPGLQNRMLLVETPVISGLAPGSVVTVNMRLRNDLVENVLGRMTPHKGLEACQKIQEISQKLIAGWKVLSDAVKDVKFAKANAGDRVGAYALHDKMLSPGEETSDTKPQSPMPSDDLHEDSAARKPPGLMDCKLLLRAAAEGTISAMAAVEWASKMKTLLQCITYEAKTLDPVLDKFSEVLHVMTSSLVNAFKYIQKFKESIGDLQLEMYLNNACASALRLAESILITSANLTFPPRNSEARMDTTLCIYMWATVVALSGGVGGRVLTSQATVLDLRADPMFLSIHPSTQMTSVASQRGPRPITNRALAPRRTLRHSRLKRSNVQSVSQKAIKSPSMENTHMASSDCKTQLRSLFRDTPCAQMCDIWYDRVVTRYGERAAELCVEGMINERARGNMSGPTGARMDVANASATTNAVGPAVAMNTTAVGGLTLQQFQSWADLVKSNPTNYDPEHTLPNAEAIVLLSLGQSPGGGFDMLIFSSVQVITISPNTDNVVDFNFRNFGGSVGADVAETAVPDLIRPALLGFAPRPFFSRGFRIIAAPNVVDIAGPGFVLFSVSIQNTNTNQGDAFLFTGPANSGPRFQGSAFGVFYGNVSAGQVGRPPSLDLTNVTKIQSITVRALRPDGRPMNFHGANATLFVRFVYKG